MSVSTTTSLVLLLLMSTLHTIRPAFGWLGQTSSPDAETCNATIYSSIIAKGELPPVLTVNVSKCDYDLFIHGLRSTCQQEVTHAISHEAAQMGPTELQCRTQFEWHKCYTRKACKYCAHESANAWLNISASSWTPRDAECTRWAAYDLPMACLEHGAEKCRATVEAQESTYLAEAEQWLKLAKSDLERQCKSNYYKTFKFSLAACQACSDDAIDTYQKYLNKTLDAYRDECQQWKAWAPKMVCFPDMRAQMTKLADCNTIMERNNVPQSCANKALSKELKYRDGNPRAVVCKATYFIQKCTYEQMLCKYCDKPVQLLDTVKQIWDPSVAECTEWSSEAPTWECYSFPWAIVGLSVVSLVAMLLIVVVVVVICCTCSDGEKVRSSSITRGHPEHEQGHGKSAGGSMQPVGTMQPIQV